MRPGTDELTDREVHLWYVRTDQIREAAALDHLAGLLSEDERERRQRFHFAEGRHQYLVSHGFLRLVLSRYADVCPSDWRFIRNAYGKPGIHSPPGRESLRSLHFNLTHTNDLAACVVVRDREVGVDAEDIHRRGRDVSDDLIRYCLSEGEKRNFERVPLHERNTAFFDYWTLKEAYLKARGFGLSLPVEAITFDWPSGTPHSGPVGATFGPEINDDSFSWQFERYLATPRHKVAIAVRRASSPPLNVRIREWTAADLP